MKGRRSTSALIIGAIAATLLSLGAPTASANSSYESQFVNKINSERAKKGKSQLVVKSDLVSVARRHSGRMAKEGDIWHNQNLANEVKGWTVLGENVGMGPSVDSLHKAFMDSKGHRDNILLSDYNQIGVGVVVDDGTIYVTEVFARRASSSSSSSSGGSSSSSSSGSTVTAASAGTAAPVAPPKPKPKPLPKPKSRTVDQLVLVVSLDDVGG